jgi:hypothetical protein
MSTNLRTKLLLGALTLGFATAGLAGKPLPVNPMLIDALTPAAPRVEELSLPVLEERLRETKAMPAAKKAEVFAEVDALMAQFRDAHARGDDLAPLWEPYSKLITKIQALAKRDTKLVRDVTASKDPIWSVLADRAQFASLH